MARRAAATPRASRGGGARRRRRGGGLAAKIATAFAATIAVLMGVGGFVIYGQNAAALDEVIDVYGATVARAIALQGIDTWQGLQQTAPQRLASLATIRAGDEDIDVDVVDVFIRDDRTKKFVAKAKRRSATFSPIRGTRNFVAVGSDGTSVETATEIEEGEIELEGRVVPARSFVQPIYEGGRRIGHVRLILSEDRVAARKRNIALFILAVTLGTILAGVAVSLVLANAFTTPLANLVDAVDAVARGNYDRRVFARSGDEIGVLAQSIDAMTESLREGEENREALAERDREMSLVADLRRNLLPNERPDVAGFEIEASYRPTSRVGGNYYDFLEFKDGRIAVLVANTAGEGVLAGFTMNLFRGFVHAETAWADDPIAMLERVNRHLNRDVKKGIYVTCLMVLVTPGSDQVQLVNAGHLPVLMWSAEEKKLRVASTDGIALGFDDGPIFNARLKASPITLNKNDRIVLYTEGVYKIRSADDEELGETGFNKLVAKNAPMHSAAFINLVERQMEKFREGGEETGDYTIITLKKV